VAKEIVEQPGTSACGKGIFMLHVAEHNWKVWLFAKYQRILTTKFHCDYVRICMIANSWPSLPYFRRDN
jgi:hypothetical protein